MSTTTAAGRLTPIEARAYFETALDGYQVEDLAEEPAAAELEDYAETFRQLAWLRRASDAHEEIHDPFVLPLLEGMVPTLRSMIEDSEASQVDESETAAQHTETLAALRGLIERARAHEPEGCFVCNAPAVYRGPAGVLACERCARFAHANDLGESFAMGEMICEFVGFMRRQTFGDDELMRAFASAVNGGEVLVGAQRESCEAIQRERAEGTRSGLGEADRWREHWTPIPGVAVASLRVGPIGPTPPSKGDDAR